MEIIESINRAIEFVEKNLCNELSMGQASEQTFYSSSHFQRMFSMVCGLPFGEYVRKRKMSVAADLIVKPKTKIDDVAAMFGYESAETFSKAFTRFHGITPTAARAPGAKLKSYCRINVIVAREGGCLMDYRIENASFSSLFGFGEGFYGEVVERFSQEETLWERSREQQNELLSHVNIEDWYEINMNFRADGFDHFIAIKSDEPIPEYTEIDVPEGQYAVFETERMKYPITQLAAMRRQIATQWLPSSGYSIADRPEITVTHWYRSPRKAKRYIELWIPVKGNNKSVE